jgi:hypothetical protein
MIKKTLKLALKFLVACLLIILFYLIYVVLINLKDQPESPTAREFSEAISILDLEAQENNGYIFMMGLNAPKDKDPFAIGLDRVKWIQEMNDQPLEIASELPHKFPKLDSYLPEEIKSISHSCTNPTKKCIKLIEDNREVLNNWFSENKWLISRYEKLISYSSWREPNITNIYSPIADYSSITFLQRLYCIFAFSGLDTGNSADVVNFLDLSTSFWRSSLTQNTNLISKMMSAALVRNNLQWTNIIFLELAAANQISKVPESIADPFRKDELSMKLVYIGEWHFVRNAFDERDFGIHNPPPYKYILFAFQPQLSRNLHAEILKRAIDISDQDLANFESALIASKTDNSTPALNFLDFLYPYNITGNLILKDVNDSDFLNYTARIKDLEGSRRALLLSIKTMMGDAFDPMDPQLVNPYTQKPIHHKPENRSFEFIGLSQQGSYNTYEYFY